MRKVACRVCHARNAASGTIPVATEWYTNIRWVICRACGVCYPKDEDYSGTALDYRAQIKAVVQRAKEIPTELAVKVFTTLGDRREDFLAWNLGDLDNLRRTVRKQARAIRRRLRAKRSCTGNGRGATNSVSAAGVEKLQKKQAARWISHNPMV